MRLYEMLASISIFVFIVSNSGSARAQDWNKSDPEIKCQKIEDCYKMNIADVAIKCENGVCYWRGVYWGPPTTPKP